MPAIVEFPQVVEDAIKKFGDIFANEPERRHLGEYLTGLLLVKRKIVNGMNAEFAQTTDQSCLAVFTYSFNFAMQTGASPSRLTVSLNHDVEEMVYLEYAH